MHIWLKDSDIHCLHHFSHNIFKYISANFVVKIIVAKAWNDHFNMKNFHEESMLCANFPYISPVFYYALLKIYTCLIIISVCCFTCFEMHFCFLIRYVPYKMVWHFFFTFLWKEIWILFSDFNIKLLPVIFFSYLHFLLFNLFFSIIYYYI